MAKTPSTHRSEIRPTSSHKSIKENQDENENEYEIEREIICREHSYCYKPSDPSCYPVGLPWASGKLKCLPGHCKPGDRSRCENQGENERTAKREKFVKSFFPRDPATGEGLNYFLQMACLAGDMDIHQKIREMVRNRIGSSSSTSSGYWK